MFFFHKRDVTSAILRVTKDVLKEEDVQWTTVTAKNRRVSGYKCPEDIEIITANRFTAEVN